MAEKSFADYVKDVMSVLPSVDRSNMFAPTTMTAEEVAAYRANPFYRQEGIRQRIAAEEAAKRTPTTPIPQGMMAGGGDSGGYVGTSPGGYISNGPMGPGFTMGEVGKGALQGFLQGGFSPIGGLLGGALAYNKAQDFVTQAINAYGNVYGDLGNSWGGIPAAPNGGEPTDPFAGADYGVGGGGGTPAAPNGGESSDPFSGSDYGWDSSGGSYVGGDTGMGLI